MTISDLSESTVYRFPAFKRCIFKSAFSPKREQEEENASLYLLVCSSPTPPPKTECGPGPTFAKVIPDSPGPGPEAAGRTPGARLVYTDSPFQLLSARFLI